MNRKLRVVSRHELLTIVKQPSFWISLIAVPLIIVLIGLIGYFTDSSDNTTIDPGENTLNVAMIDRSGLMESEVVKPFGITIAEDANTESALTEQVKTGELDGLIIYPEDLEETGSFRVYADNTEENQASTIEATSRLLLQQSLLAPLESPALAELALTGGEVSVSAYKDGEPEQDFLDYILPGSFLVLFYIVLVFSVSYALSSVSEEKENRSIEMVLSYVRPQTLILGKLLGVILVALIQIVFLMGFAAVSYLVARALGNELSLPFNLTDLTIDPMAIAFGLGFLVVGFIFYVSIMATIGALFPSTKEASGFTSVFFILPAVPFWGISAITSDPGSLFTRFLTHFPLSAPTASLLRNAVGNLSVVEGLISLFILFASTIVTLLLASKAFRLGMLEYNSRVSFSALFRKR